MATGKGEQESGGKPRIVHLDKVTMGGFEIPRPDTPHVWIEYDFTEPDAVVSRLAGADIAILNKVRPCGAAGCSAWACSAAVR